MKYYISITTLLLLSQLAFSQFDISNDSLSYEEKIALGEAYINETFPDCDTDFFAPNCPIGKNNEKNLLSKTEWIEIYPYEYELFIYYQFKISEADNNNQKRIIISDTDNEK